MGGMRQDGGAGPAGVLLGWCDPSVDSDQLDDDHKVAADGGVGAMHEPVLRSVDEDLQTGVDQ